MTILRALKISTEKLKQKNISSAYLDAEVLLLEALNGCGKNVGKSWLYVNSDYLLNEKERRLFNNFISQRKKHKPVAYITNRKEFYGCDFYVDENVLIPRPETEIMVEEVLKIVNRKKNKSGKSGFNLIDIGTGSGCIIMSILNELIRNKKGESIHNAIANDISAEAIKVAKINAKKYNLDKKIKFITGDLKKAANKKNFSASSQFIVTANLPYIKNNDYRKLSGGVKKYEPKIALKGGKDGLECIERLIGTISKLKFKHAKKIFIVLESDPWQTDKIKNISESELGNASIKIIKDLSQKKRVVVIKLPT